MKMLLVIGVKDIILHDNNTDEVGSVTNPLTLTVSHEIRSLESVVQYPYLACLYAAVRMYGCND